MDYIQISKEKYQILDKSIRNKCSFYFIGIGGCGMSSLACIIKELGCQVKGSNLCDSMFTELIINNNIDLNFVQQPKNIDQSINIVVISSAIPNNNLELKKALELNIPVFHRSHILKYLFINHTNSIGIMGSAGKGTFTAGLIDFIGTRHNCNYSVGGILRSNQKNFNYDKKNDWFIAEIDESDGSFFNLKPKILVITNIDLDHVSYLKSIENFQNLIIQFILENQIKNIYINQDDENSYNLFNKLKNKDTNLKINLFNKNNTKDIKIRNILTQNFSSFILNDLLIQSPLFSKYNIENLINIINISLSLGIDIKKIINNAKSFEGLFLRSTLNIIPENTVLIQNYAHESNEIKLNLEEINNHSEEVIAVYEPFYTTNWINDDLVREDVFKKAKKVLMIDSNNILHKKLNYKYHLFQSYDKLYSTLKKDIIKKNQIIFFFCVNNKKNNMDIFKICDNLINCSINKLSLPKNGNLFELLKDVDCKIYGCNTFINYLSEDNRDIADNTLFFCSKGGKFDSHSILDDIIKNSNCKAIVSELDPLTLHIPWIKVKNIKLAKAQVCYQFYNWSEKKDQLKIIGITGTNGKTSTTSIIKSLLEQNNKKVLHIGTLGAWYNNKNWTQESFSNYPIIEFNKIIQRIDADLDFIVMEVTSHGLEEYRVYGLPFNIVGLTNITQDHLDYHLTMENYINAKKKIFDLKADFEIINFEYKDIINKKINTFGQNIDATFKIEEIQYSEQGTSFKLNDILINTPYMGYIYVENVTLALICLKLLNFSIDNSYQYPQIDGRLNKISSNPTIIIDFAHTPDALNNLLSVCKNINKENILIFGCGGDRDKSKRYLIAPIVEKFHETYWIITSDNPRTENPLEICQQLKNESKYEIIVDRKKAIFEGIKNAKENNKLLIIAGKGHEQYIIFGKEKYHYNDQDYCLFINKFINKRILLIGNGISTNSAQKILSSLTNNIDFYDTQDIDFFDIIIPSPSVPLNHRIYSYSKYIIGEIELAYQKYSNVNWIGITGTNGKTTLTSILGKFFENVVGNIGIPCSILPEYIKLNTPIVAELSSFQLSSIDKFKPKIAVILNITPDHIDYHGSFENYKLAKLNITRNQTEKDLIILPPEEWAISLKTKAKKIYFGTSTFANCIYSEEDQIFFKENKKIKNIFYLENKNLIGLHNHNNLIIAGFIAYLNKIDKNVIERELTDFKPLEHRLELVRDNNGVKFINDSKATNIDSCIKALDSCQNIILLMGGLSKGCNPYLEIYNYSQKFKGKIKKIIAYGSSTDMIKNIPNYNQIFIIVETLKEGLSIAKKISSKNDNILLSPACSSLDQFKNFKDRGYRFKSLVNE